MRSAAASRRYANSDGFDEGYDSRERNGGIVVDDVQELGRLADVNLAQTWALLARLMGVPVGRAESAVFVATGLDAAFFNGVYVVGPTHDPDAVVHGPAGADTFRDVTARGFEMPIDFTTRLVSEATLADPGIAAVLGTVAGEPVSVALVSVTGTTAGIYMVATPDQHRRRGYGAAITWAAIREGARLGCDHAILQASELGAPVYRDMGFVDIGRYVQLASR